jgi:hypothetical protein
VQVQLLASLTAHTYLTHRASGITSGNDYDYGSGWLQADNAFFAAFVYTRGKPKAIKAYAIPI